MLSIDLLKNMSYDGNDYRQFWNSNDYYFCRLKKMQDGVIKLVSCNEIYKNIGNFSREIDNSNIEEIYNEEYVNFIHGMFEKCIKSEDVSIKYVREFNTDKGMSVWNVTAIFDGEYLRIMGERITRDAILNYFPESRYQGDIQWHVGVKDSAMLLKTERGYIIESFSVGMKEICFGKDYTGRVFNEILPATLHKDMLMYAIDRAVDENRPISFYDYLKYSEFNSYVRITLSPIIHISATRVFMSISRVFNIEEYDERNQEMLSSGMAECIIDVDNSNFKYITYINRKMAMYIDAHMMNINDILNLDDISYCIEEGTIISGVLEKEYPEGGKVKYNYHFTPIVYNEKLLYIKATFSQPNVRGSAKDRMLKTLTNRERQVAGYILEGNTNKYISSVLNVSEGTVKKMIYNIYRKLGVVSRVEMVKLFAD